MTTLPRTIALIVLASSCALAQQAPAVQTAGIADQAAQEAENAARAELRAKKEVQEKLELLAAHNKIVTGKPYTASSSTEIVQTLSDGNRIVQHSSSVIYRDTQGRVRREQTFAGVEAHPGETKIFIDDPVSGTAFVLEPDQKTARRISSSREVMLKLERTSNTMANVKLPKLDEQHDIVQEDLGTKNVQGLPCTGKRQTITIPSGQVGNERPIAIVTETWFSPDIDAVVQSSTNDPRFGQTTYTLQNPQLKDQPNALFVVPADYRVEN